MGNFSREDTFDPLKNYVAVRLQQGVPIVDADWNELNDVIRHELYDSLNLLFPDGVLPGSDSLKVSPISDSNNEFTNNLKVCRGKALIGGRILHVREDIIYSLQPWTNSGQNIRTDIVYLDVWEREVDSIEDTTLKHPDISIETCVRLKREVAVRVKEDTDILPEADVNHIHMPLALLNRDSDSSIKEEDIIDKRPFIYSLKGIRESEISFTPRIINTGNITWINNVDSAYKSYNDTAVGIIPIALPNKSRIKKFHIKGFIRGLYETTNPILVIQLKSIDALWDEETESLNSYDRILISECFETEEQSKFIDRDVFGGSNTFVDNSRFHYYFKVMSPQDSYARITNISIAYEY